MSQLASSEGSGTAKSLRGWKERDRPVLAYGLMLLAAVSLVLHYFIKFPTLPDETAASFREYLDKRLSLQSETNDAKTLERYFETGGLFPAADTGFEHVHAERWTCASRTESQSRLDRLS